MSGEGMANAGPGNNGQEFAQCSGQGGGLSEAMAGAAADVAQGVVQNTVASNAVVSMEPNPVAGTAANMMPQGEAAGGMFCERPGAGALPPGGAPVDTSVQLGALRLKNPIIPASGTFGFGYEMAAWYDLNVLGGMALKGTTQQARFGNPTPRIAECAAGMLNGVGLQNPGVDAVIAEELPKLQKVYDGPVIANVCGFSVEEYVHVAQKFDAVPMVDILEINVSCPNVQHGGMAFGTSCEAAASVTKAVKAAVKKPVYIKLSPNVTDIAAIAKACRAEGADGFTAVNTLLGMRIEPRTGRPIVSIGAAGFSGPAIKPVALRMVYEVCAAVDVPVIGVGGIASADDVLEFIWAGAAAVQVGTQTLVEPTACKMLAETLPQAMRAYGIQSLAAIRGRAHP